MKPKILSHLILSALLAPCLHALTPKARSQDAGKQASLTELDNASNPVSFLERAKAFERSAKEGQVDAYVLLGDLYSTAPTLDRDYDAAIEAYRAAAEQGNVRAMLRLGEIHEAGNVGATDYGEAMRWYLQATSADKRNAEALYRIGHLYQEGWGVERSDGIALSWFFKALARDPGHSAALAGVRRIDQEGQERGEPTSSSTLNQRH